MVSRGSRNRQTREAQLVTLINTTPIVFTLARAREFLAMMADDEWSYEIDNPAGPYTRIKAYDEDGSPLGFFG